MINQTKHYNPYHLPFIWNFFLTCILLFWFDCMYTLELWIEFEMFELISSSSFCFVFLIPYKPTNTLLRDAPWRLHMRDLMQNRSQLPRAVLLEGLQVLLLLEETGVLLSLDGSLLQVELEQLLLLHLLGLA